MAKLIFEQACKNDETGDKPCIEVDYGSIEALKAILEENPIHTIICTFSITGDSLSKSQFNLIKAAELSTETKRFIPSPFAIAYPRE